MPVPRDPAALALHLAALGWHILPLSPASKRPLGNCPRCQPRPGAPAHLARACPAGGATASAPPPPPRTSSAPGGGANPALFPASQPGPPAWS
jgi:hypothetical protein